MVPSNGMFPALGGGDRGGESMTEAMLVDARGTAMPGLLERRPNAIA